MDLAASIGFFGVEYASARGGEMEVTTFEDLGIAYGVFAEVRCYRGKQLRANHEMCQQTFQLYV